MKVIIMTVKKTHSEYVADVNLVNSNIEVIGRYNGASIKIKHRCKVCGYEWDAKPNSILSGKGCPECAKIKRAKSKTKTHEQFVSLISNNIKYEQQKRFSDCKNERTLPFDFYLPDYKCCIEYDGAQHYKEVDCWGGREYLSRRQRNDKIKDDYCAKNNMRLIRIRYDEDVCDTLEKVPLQRARRFVNTPVACGLA